MEKIKRYSKEEKGKVDVDCPQIVKEYNKQMGGVDLADMLVALYRIPMKTRRWYMGIFVQLADILINNAWLMYRQTRKISLKQFRRELYDDLISLGKSENRSHDAKSKALAMGATTNPTKPRPPDEVKFDEVGHFPQFGELGRCRLCQLKTTVLCIKYSPLPSSANFTQEELSILDDIDLEDSDVLLQNLPSLFYFSE
ncbi:hypothetical protein HF086_007425 [Spodoptera exigua]|uniref:PiggyBac transposable element-derived protein domain-containing protein n=1 Tax=Spodoptera exigua TaxID=7107 RepID=A0A922MRD4_SPOEX|nr:hypothetical protein HF086_007425 [Spodoptera exigua]